MFAQARPQPLATHLQKAEPRQAAELHARAAAKLEGGLGGFALVVWNDKGEPTAWWDCGQLPAWSLPDFARRVLENSQDAESEHAADG